MKDRIRGALYGVAVGDALGAPLEFMEAEEIQKKYGKAVCEMVGGGWLNVAPGEITDDTQMTIAVAEGIVESPKSPIISIGRRFCEWYKSNPKDIGNTCRMSIAMADRLVETGHSEEDVWREAVRRPHEDGAAGNGALMRTIYPALYYKDENVAAEFTRAIAWMTHPNEASAALCMDYVRLVSMALIAPEQAIQEITRIVQGYGERKEPTGWVVASMENALYAIMLTGTFEDAVVEAVNRGGDADTIGAITGGLAGSVYGFEAIPQRWVSCLSSDVRSTLDHLANEAVMAREG